MAMMVATWKWTEGHKQQPSNFFDHTLTWVVHVFVNRFLMQHEVGGHAFEVRSTTMHSVQYSNENGLQPQGRAMIEYFVSSLRSGPNNDQY